MTPELPIPNFDGLPAGELQSRLRTLPADQLEQVLTHEREHAHRPAVLQLGEHRLAELRSGAEPSGGAPDGLVPGVSSSPGGEGPVTPQTAGPKQNPPSQGDPTNPAQPR